MLSSFFSSFGASTQFEKHRLELTSKSLDAPNEESMRNILRTFSGDDPETKSQIAYATIIKKIYTSDNRSNWIYILKNLIIFDRVVQQSLFSQQIAELALPNVDNYKQYDSKYEQFDTESIIRGFWALIKSKSTILISKDHVFYFKRSQRMDYLSKMSPSETFRQIDVIQNFFAKTFEFVEVLSGKKLKQSKQMKKIRIKKNLQQTGLIQYLYLQIMHKFMLYYSCQLLCLSNILQIITKSEVQGIKEEELKKFKKQVLKFKVNTNQFIQYVEERKYIKGFEEVNYKELNPFQNLDIIKLIDELSAQKQESSRTKPIENLAIQRYKLKVQKNPNEEWDTQVMVPRLKQNIKKLFKKMNKMDSSSNPFENWNNSYSYDFPQKEVMTLDLIIQIKQEEKEIKSEGESNQEDVVRYERQTTITIDESHENSSNWFDEINFKNCQENIGKTPDIHNFQSIYSQVSTQWNQDF